MAGPPVASRTSRLWGLVVLYGLVPGLICIDLINGALTPPGKSGGLGAAQAQVSPGTIIRGLLTMLAVTIVLRLRAKEMRPMKRWFLVLAAFGVAGPALGFVRGGGGHDFMADMVDLSKILYAPSMIALFLVLLRRTLLTLEDIFSAIALTGALAGVSILLSNVLGIGLSTYMWQRAGFKGLFISQNELGLTMGISLFACAQSALTTGRARYLAMCTCTIAGMLLLGTRAAALGAFAAPVGVLAVNAPRLLSGRRRMVVLALATLLCAGLAVAGLWEYQLIREQRFEAAKFEALMNRGLLFVRGILIVGSVKYMAHRSLLTSLFGEGTVRYQFGVARVLRLTTEGKAAEVDWLDLVGGYGAIFAILLYSFYVGFIKRTRVLTRIYGTPIRLTVLMMIGWFLAHSIVAGHALGPMPAGTLAPLLAYVWMIKGEGPPRSLPIIQGAVSTQTT